MTCNHCYPMCQCGAEAALVIHSTPRSPEEHPMSPTSQDAQSRCPFNLGCNDDGEPCAHAQALQDARRSGQRDTRMAIDATLGDGGKGTLADLQLSIKALMRHAAMGHAFKPAGGLAGPRACGVVVTKPEGERLCCLPEWAHSGVA